MSMKYEPPSGAAKKGRPRWVFWLLIGVATACVVLAVIGFPLLPTPSKNASEHPFHVFGVAVGAWQRHPGWRYTSDSWVYWAAAAGCLIGALVPAARTMTFTIRYVVVAVPMAVLLAIGPLLQRLVGLPDSNFDPEPPFGKLPGVNALVVAGLLVLVYVSTRFRGAVRRRARST